MKKILIWDKGLVLRNSGGPSGYLWNLKQFLANNDVENDQIFFYTDVIECEDIKISLLDRCINALFRYLRLHTLASLYTMYFAHSKLSNKEICQIRNFDYIHIHNMSFMLRYGRQLKREGIKVIYTTHTPELMIDEVMYSSSVCIKKIEKLFINRELFVSRELHAYKLADYIMFPVHGVQECYTLNSKKVQDFFKNAKNIFFNPTAILDNDKKETESKILDQYCISPDSKIICYVGRHTTVKGYYYLKEIARVMLNKRNDIYFVIGGAQGASTPLNHKNWIELGWVDTQQLLKEIDVFILPNKQTYFDIIALEVLRSGKALITTLTGGNKYFEQINNGGISFIPFDDASRACAIIESILLEDIHNRGNKCRNLFLENFTFYHYVENYINQIDKL